MKQNNKAVRQLGYKATRSHSCGFTLIELLVVISVIGVLTSLVIMNVMGVRERVRDSQRKSDLNQISKALEMYYNEFGKYPPDLTDNDTSIGQCFFSEDQETWGDSGCHPPNDDWQEYKRPY